VDGERVCADQVSLQPFGGLPFRNGLPKRMPDGEGYGDDGSVAGITDDLFPGCWRTPRPMTAQELKAALLLWMGIEEATAKTKSGLTSPSFLGRSDIVELSSYILNEFESLRHATRAGGAACSRRAPWETTRFFQGCQ
jgi:hypothetical protein